LDSQARRLAALLALRQAGSEQYFWRFAFRASARKNTPQNRQLWSVGRAMADPPCAEYGSATALCHAHYGQIGEEQQRRIKKTEYRRRRSKRTCKWKLSKKIDEENPLRSHRQI
jgi:hypothetical protein